MTEEPEGRVGVASGQARLLEREAELDVLDRLIEDAQSGSAHVALVEGPAGIGKTRLVAEARARATAAGMSVLWARGGELEREFPFGVVRQLFEPIVLHPDHSEGLLAGAAAAARPVFEPENKGRAATAAEEATFAALHGLYWVTVNLTANGPLLLAIDDLHWCDHPSLRFLAYLVRRLEGLPALVVCGLRPAEPGTDRAMLAEIARDPLAVSIEPGPLGEPSVAQLVRERLGDEPDDAFTVACRSTTGGNPLLLTELLRALQAEGARPDASHIRLVADLGPRAASRSVLVRLARLPDEAVDVARAAAVLGDGAELTTVAALAGLDEQQAAQATRQLVRAEILRPGPPLGFVHPLVGAAVYGDLTAGEQQLQHERAASLLMEARAPVEQVAAHLLLVPARGAPHVVETLRSAASAALQKGAAESAVTYLSRALVEPPASEHRPWIVRELGLAEALTSGRSAAEHLREAYETLADPLARVAVGEVLVPTLLFSGRPAESAEIAQQIAAGLPPELDDLRRLLEARELFSLFFGLGEAEALRRLEPYRTRPGPGLGAKMLASLAAWEWASALGPRDECVQLALDALAGDELIESDRGVDFSVNAISVLVYADRDDALDVWDDALAKAQRRGSLYAAAGLRLWRGFSLYRRGDLRDAEADLRSAFDELVLWGYGEWVFRFWGGFLAPVLIERGDLDGARQALDRAGDLDFGPEGARLCLNSQLELHVAEGRVEEAIEIAEVIARRFDYAPNPAAGPWRSVKAQALDRLGRTDEALAVAREELELARRWGAPWALGRALRVLGTLEREEGLEQLEEAVSVLDGSLARLEHAKALAALGRALRHARRPTEAREPLRRALELADVCGASALAAEVRSELHAAGLRPRTTALRGIEALTASESRVAALAAEGQSNRDIAQALFVTPKTVEVHLSSAYRKLGIRSRRELAGALAGA